MAGSGGAEGDRTPDLVIANDALSQLSHDPLGFFWDFGADLSSSPKSARSPPGQTALTGGRGTAAVGLVLGAHRAAMRHGMIVSMPHRAAMGRRCRAHAAIGGNGHHQTDLTCFFKDQGQGNLVAIL